MIYVKRLLLSILLVVCVAGSGWATDYYVNSVTGTDSNNGTSPSTPWKHPQYAASMVAADDTVTIVAPATTPSRLGLVTQTNGGDGTEITWQGTSATEKAYVNTLLNVSPGADSGNMIINGDVESWTDSTSTWIISNSSATITQETTIVHGGNCSAKFVCDGTDIRIYDSGLRLPESTDVTFSYWHYETENGDNFQYSWKNVPADPDEYLRADDTWGAYDGYTNPNDPSLNAWAQTTHSFTTDTDTGRYDINIWQREATTNYIDDISLTLDDGYQWIDGGGVSYQRLNVTIPVSVKTFFKCTETAWNSSGVSALTHVPMATSAANCDATENTWWWDGNYILYYNPPSGETISSMHFEVDQPGVTNKVNGTTCVLLSNTWQVLKYLSCIGQQYNFHVTAANNDISYCDGVYADNGNFYYQATGSISNCYGAYTYTEDNFHAAGAGVLLTATNCWAEYPGDDNFQVAGGADLVGNNLVCLYAGEQDMSDSTGIISEGDDSYININNCTVYGSYGAGIRDNGTAASTVTNCIAWGNGTDVYGDGTGLTASYNCYSSNTSWDTDASDVTLNPLFVDVSGSDFRLQEDSPCIDNGTGVGLTNDYEGRSIPQGGGFDIGAYEKQYYFDYTDIVGTPVPQNGTVDIGAYEYKGGFKSWMLEII